MSYSYQQSFNATLNALPKDQRRDYKLANIAAVDRQQVGTDSYRPYNQYTSPGEVAPTVGRPMDIDPKYVSGIGSTAVVNP
jgi:hypothetical protein